MKRFEYKVVEGMFLSISPNSDKTLEATLNKLGSQGWELVSTLYAPESYDSVTVVLKRELVP